MIQDGVPDIHEENKENHRYEGYLGRSIQINIV
jgi:hypothetical protein